MSDKLKDKLSDEQYRVTQEKGTERPFSGEFVDHKADGTYSCVVCGNELFDSGTKYDSGSGWPSFWEQVSSDAIKVVEDNSLGMRREEILCSACDSHLGHVFSDGPKPSGLRYCVNSASLGFNKRETDK